MVRGERVKVFDYTAEDFSSDYGKRKNDSPGGESRKAAKVDVESLRGEVASYLDDIKRKPPKNNNDSVTKLFTAFSAVSMLVLKLIDEVETLQEESEASSNNYAKVVADNAKIKKDSERGLLGKELEDADKTLKIMDIGLVCKGSELSDLPKKIREKLSKETVTNNWLHESTISPIFPEGKINKNDKEKEYKVGCLIKCKSSDSKKQLNEAIKNEFPNFNFRYHFPSKLMKYVKQIREDFKKTKTNEFDASTAHLLIRPNRNFNGLSLKYRKTSNDSWVYIGNVELRADGTDEGTDGEELPHVALFKTLESNSSNSQ